MLTSENAIMKQMYDKTELNVTKKFETVGSQFRHGLKKLLGTLYSKNASHVRCIKPNAYKTSHRFDDKEVKHQVTCLSLIDNLRVRRAGYAYKRKYEAFLKRFRPLLRETFIRFRGSAKEGTEKVLTHLGYVEYSDYELGE